MYYLKNYKTKDLSDKILTGFDEDMQILKDEYIGVSDEELQAMQTVVANQTK